MAATLDSSSRSRDLTMVVVQFGVLLYIFVPPNDWRKLRRMSGIGVSVPKGVVTF